MPNLGFRHSITNRTICGDGWKKCQMKYQMKFSLKEVSNEAFIVYVDYVIITKSYFRRDNLNDHLRDNFLYQRFRMISKRHSLFVGKHLLDLLKTSMPGSNPYWYTYGGQSSSTGWWRWFLERCWYVPNVIWEIRHILLSQRRLVLLSQALYLIVKRPSISFFFFFFSL